MARFHGRGIEVHPNASNLRGRFGKCKLPSKLAARWSASAAAQDKQYIVMEYVSRPALLLGHKFDLRTYLLVTLVRGKLSLHYHPGFARRADAPYASGGVLAHITNHEGQSNQNHLLDLHQLGRQLHKEHPHIFEENFMQVRFEGQAVELSRFVFEAGRPEIAAAYSTDWPHTPSRWQLFALDWMIDASAGATHRARCTPPLVGLHLDWSLDDPTVSPGVHLLEANGNPLIKAYSTLPGMAPGLWRNLGWLLRCRFWSKGAPIGLEAAAADSAAAGVCPDGLDVVPEQGGGGGGGGGGGWGVEQAFGEWRGVRMPTQHLDLFANVSMTEADCRCGHVL